MTLLLIFLAGGIGCVLRYGIVLLTKPHAPVFPLGTLVVNVIGCFVLGLLAHWVFVRDGAHEGYKAAVLVGLLGGFTTFSSFGYDTLALWRAGEQSLAILNIVLNNVLGIGAAGAGLWVASLLARAPAVGP